MPKLREQFYDRCALASLSASGFGEHTVSECLSPSCESPPAHLPCPDGKTRSGFGIPEAPKELTQLSEFLKTVVLTREGKQGGARLSLLIPGVSHSVLLHKVLLSAFPGQLHWKLLAVRSSGCWFHWS